MKKIIHANNIDYLRTLKDNSVDSVVTDPPYGINFMNKKWDYDVPSVELWQEVLRVLKPGGHMLVACGTRTQHRMAVNIEDAGFEIRDIVAWVYGSGFPKSTNVTIQIDKKLGAMGHRGKAHQAFVVGKGRAEDGKELEKSKAMEQHKGITEQAKKWQGWGTALKPSMELWTLARKPLDGTVAQNILEYGVGGLNIDESRVEGETRTVPIHSNDIKEDNTMFGLHPTIQRERVETKLGRFPANFIHDGSDEVVSLFPDSNGAGGSIPNSKITGYGKNIGDGTYEYYGGDRKVFESGSGSASRFFYVAKASQEERDFGLYDFEDKQMYKDTREGNSFDVFVKRDKNGKPLNKKRKNIHPTVKPIELMRYLVRMITPPNGICLDPYLGSGTTAIACEMEKFNYIGIELDEQYIEIAKARVVAVKDYETSLDTKTAIKESIKEDKEKELGIQNIFDFMEGE